MELVLDLYVLIKTKDIREGGKRCDLPQFPSMLVRDGNLKRFPEKRGVKHIQRI